MRSARPFASRSVTRPEQNIHFQSPALVRRRKSRPRAVASPFRVRRNAPRPFPAPRGGRAAPDVDAPDREVPAPGGEFEPLLGFAQRALRALLLADVAADAA